MKGNEIIRDIGDIDDDSIQRAEPKARTLQKRKLKKRVHVAAAISIVAILMFTTAFAYGNEIIGEIKRLMLGRLVAEQIERPYDLQDNVQTTSFSLVNRSVENSTSILPVEYLTVEEANKFAPFIIKEPSLMVKSMMLECVSVFTYEDGSLSYDAFLNYRGLDGGFIQLWQFFGGADANFEIETTSPIESILVGDIEALLIIDYISERDKDSIRGVQIAWMENDIGYLMHVFMRICEDDIEMFIAVAESVG